MTTAAAPGTVATYGQVLREPRFRVLFGSRSLAIAADALRSVALSVLVFELTSSPLLAALTYGIAFLPQVIGGTLLGSLADRLRPRRLIVGAYLFEAATAVLLASGRPGVAGSLLLVAAVACITPVFAGASNRLVAEVLEGDAYVLGRSLSNMSISAAQLLGIAVGGIATAALGAPLTLLVSGVGHLLAALVVRIWLPDLPPNTATGTSSGSVVGESWRANRRLLADPRVRTLFAVQWLPPAFVAGAEGLIIPYATVRGAEPGNSGLLLAFTPIGMIIGNWAVGRYVRPVTRERLTVPLMIVLGLPLVFLAADVSLPVVAALTLVTGVGFAYGLGVQRQFVEAVPEADRGVAFGLLSTGVMTLQGVGPVVFGALAQVTTVATAMGCAGAATLITALFLWAALRRHVPIVDEHGRRIHHDRSRLAKAVLRTRAGVPVHSAEAPMKGAGPEIPLVGGDVTEGLVRVANTVRRPHQPQSPAVAAYLGHLATVGFDAAPRWHGRDDRGRDIVDYIEGAVPGTPLPPWCSTDDVVAEMGRLLRRLHDASESFVPPPDARWFGQDLRVDLPERISRLFETPELVSHCDVTPQNTVFRDGHPVALIDFDVARPTTRLLDVIDTATWWVPLMHPSDRAPAHAHVDVPARLRIFVDAYGLDEERRAAFLDLAEKAGRRSWYLMEATAQQQGGGWARMWADGVGFWIRRRLEWLTAERDVLERALRSP